MAELAENQVPAADVLDQVPVETRLELPQAVPGMRLVRSGRDSPEVIVPAAGSDRALDRRPLCCVDRLQLPRAPVGPREQVVAPTAEVDQSWFKIVGRKVDEGADRALLEQERCAVSEITPFCINGKALSICFAAGPSGELVELVEMGGA